MGISQSAARLAYLRNLVGLGRPAYVPTVACRAKMHVRVGLRTRSYNLGIASAPAQAAATHRRMSAWANN